MKTGLRIVAPTTEKRTVTPRRRPNAELRTREFLTEAEIEKLIKAAGKNRWGHRDATMILVAYRHGLRVSELVDLRWDQIDFPGAVLHVRRVKQGTPPRIPSVATGYGHCASCSASRNRGHHSYSRLSVARHSPQAGLPSSWSALVRPPGWASQPTRTCCGTPAALRWPTRATIPVRCRPISATRTSSIRSGIPSFRRIGSRISGGADRRPTPDAVKRRPPEALSRSRKAGSCGVTTAAA